MKVTVNYQGVVMVLDIPDEIYHWATRETEDPMQHGVDMFLHFSRLAQVKHPGKLPAEVPRMSEVLEQERRKAPGYVAPVIDPNLTPEQLSQKVYLDDLKANQDLVQTLIKKFNESA